MLAHSLKVLGKTGTEMELKQGSSTKSLVQNLILFLLLYLSLLKTEEYQGKGGTEMEQKPVVFVPHVLSLPFVFGKTSNE